MSSRRAGLLSVSGRASRTRFRCQAGTFSAVRTPLTRKDLDQLSTDVPIVALRARRGAALLNTAALKKAGMAKDMPSYAGKPIPKDNSGELTGELPDWPAGLYAVDKVVPEPTPPEEDQMVADGQKQRNALGITSIRDLSNPDGRWIVFPSNAGGSVQVWKVSAQGGEDSRRILTWRVAAPAWRSVLLQVKFVPGPEPKSGCNTCGAQALYSRFGRVHQTRVTPAMEAGISEHVWAIEEVVAVLR